MLLETHVTRMQEAEEGRSMMGWGIECGMVCGFVFIFFYLCLLGGGGGLGNVSSIFWDLLLVRVL